MENEQNRPKVTFTFDFWEDREEIKKMINYAEPYSRLNEIYNMVRSELKHGDEELSPYIEQLLERVKEEAWME